MSFSSPAAGPGLPDSFEGTMMSRHDYDLLVIGSGPAGHRTAIQGAKLDKRVAVVEKQTVVGGVCINTGTIPSKTLREAALRLSGYRERGMYGASYSVKQHITMRDPAPGGDRVLRRGVP
jgi:NAD(P) transhydrogenase